MKNKIHLQCGYEDKCKNKDCFNCPRRTKHNLSLTLAEEVVIEDFAMIDLEHMIKEKPKELELMQKICYKIMKKVFKTDKQDKPILIKMKKSLKDVKKGKVKKI